jgi:hypothetical protein
MPKKLRISPNERVDLVDFTRASNDYTQESLKFHRSKLIQSNRSVIAGGFRIEVPDQVANPGQFVVYNGVAIDRNGDILNNEQQINDSRVVTVLGASNTFYVEIEFIETDSDVDARAFWDPTFSGNTPPGKEFYLNIATRITPDWKVVSPVSTTGFAETTDPDSPRIPLAIFSTDSNGRISGFTKLAASTVLERDAIATATSLRVLDSSLLPDSGSIVVGGEFKTLVTNDRANNLLTIAAPGLTADKKAGAIVNSGPAVFVIESTEAVPSFGPDRRRLLFKGDEIRGSALASSKYYANERDDLDIKSLKDLVDFQSSQIREMKFGNLRSDVNSTPPPTNFISTRYYDNAGSITGARTYSATVGDGYSSFGDFNDADNLASCIQDAHDSFPPEGGSIYVKSGYYVWNTTVTFSKPITLVFDAGVTFTGGTYSGSLIFTDNIAYKVVGLPDMSAYHSFDLTFNNPTGLDLTLDYCNIGRVIFGSSSTNVKFIATNSKFVNVTSGLTYTITSNIVDLVNVKSILFDNCIISYKSTASGGTLLKGHFLNMEFRNCTFDAAESTGSCNGFVASDASGYLKNLKFDNCSFIDSSTSALSFGLLFASEYIENVLIEDCTFDFHWAAAPGSPPHAIAFIPVSHVKDCSVVDSNFAPLCSNGFTGTTSSNFGRIVSFSVSSSLLSENNVVRNNVFGRPLGSTMNDFVHSVVVETTGGGGSGLRVDIVDNTFSQFNTAVKIGGLSTSKISGNKFVMSYLAADYNYTIMAIELAAAVELVSILNNEININARCSDNTKFCYGVYSYDSWNRTIISNNSISLQGWTRNATYGVYYNLPTGPFMYPIVSSNNILISSSNSSNYGIYLTVAAGLGVSSNISNNIIKISSASTGGSISLDGVYVSCDSNPATDLIKNNISSNTIEVKAVSILTGPTVRGIVYVGKSAVISNNIIDTWYCIANYGIDFYGDNISVLGNTVTQTWHSSQTAGSLDAAIGIRCALNEVSDHRNINISNNNIVGGKSTRWNIYVSMASSSGTSVIKGLNISNNTLRMAGAMDTSENGGITLQSTAAVGGVRNVVISGNAIYEEENTTGRTNRVGIYVTSSINQGVNGISIFNNSIFGYTPISSLRTALVSYGIEVVGCQRVTVSSNVLAEWCNPTYSAANILISACDHAIITDNICSPVTGGSAAVISLLNVTKAIFSSNSATGGSGSNPYSAVTSTSGTESPTILPASHSSNIYN